MGPGVCNANTRQLIFNSNAPQSHSPYTVKSTYENTIILSVISNNNSENSKISRACHATDSLSVFCIAIHVQAVLWKA